MRTSGLVTVWLGVAVIFVAMAIGIRNGLLFGSTVQVLVTQGPVYTAEIETYGLMMVGVLAVVIGLIGLGGAEASAPRQEGSG